MSEFLGYLFVILIGAVVVLGILTWILRGVLGATKVVKALSEPVADTAPKDIQLRRAAERLMSRSGAAPTLADVASTWGRLFVSEQGDGAVGVADDAQSVLLLRATGHQDDSGNEQVRYRWVDCRDLLGSEVLVDSNTVVTQTVSKSRPSLAGAVVGGVLAGGVGAMVGGLGYRSSTSTGTSTTQETNHRVRITIKDPGDPTFVLYAPSAEPYARQLHDLLSVVVRKGDECRRDGQDTVPVPQVADEIAKLAALKEQGHVTAEEYEQQKKTLLSSVAHPVVQPSRTTQWKVVRDEHVLGLPARPARQGPGQSANKARSRPKELPDVAGKNLKLAMEAIASAGYGTPWVANDRQEPLTPAIPEDWVVVSQHPEPGPYDTSRVVALKVRQAPVSERTSQSGDVAKVESAIEAPRQHEGVPDVVGKSFDVAVSTMRSSGYVKVQYSDASGQRRQPTTRSDWVVVGQRPEPGTGLAKDQPVVLRVRLIGE